LRVICPAFPIPSKIVLAKVSLFLNAYIVSAPSPPPEGKLEMILLIFP